MVLVPFFDETEPDPPSNDRDIGIVKPSPARSHKPPLTWTRPILECLRGFLWRCVPDNGHRAMDAKAPTPGAWL